MSVKLKDRIEDYSNLSNFKLLNRVPLIISINGRGFVKTTSLLDKPFSILFAETMSSVLVRLVQEIDGVIFGYTFNDEITLIIRNDQHLTTVPWYNNEIQKISSITSSMATLYFNNYANSIDLDIVGDALFLTNAYTVPNITEAINVAIYKQQQCFQNTLQNACYFELLKKYDKNTINDMILGLSIDDKISLLEDECNVDFNEYPTAFKRGVACYKTNDNRKKWILNTELPVFTKDHSFLSSIIK